MLAVSLHLLLLSFRRLHRSLLLPECDGNRFMESAQTNVVVE